MLKNIKKIREDKKLGVNELSRISGVNASYISALERGEKKNPTVTTLKKIAKALDVTVDELLQSEPVIDEKLKEWDFKGVNLMLGDNIKLLREARKISLSKLARLADISPGYLSDIEKGNKTSPSIDVLEKLASILDVNVELFFKKDLDEVIGLPVTDEKLNEWDEKYADLKEEIIVPLEDKFKTVEDALQFLLSQNVIMSDLNLEDLSNERKIEFANEIYIVMKMLAPKYK